MTIGGLATSAAPELYNAFARCALAARTATALCCLLARTPQAVSATLLAD